MLKAHHNHQAGAEPTPALRNARAWLLGGLACAALLAACGGGGSSNPPAPVTSFAVAGVVSSLANKGAPFSGSRTDAEGNQYKLNVTYAPQGAGVYTRQETLLTNGVGGAPALASFSFNEAAAQMTITGWKNAQGVAGALSTSTPLPAMASVGTTGRWFTATLSAPNQESLLLDASWTLEALSESTAELCLRLGYVSGLTVFSDSDCFKLDARGNVTGFRAIKDFRKSTFSSQLIYQ